MTMMTMDMTTKSRRNQQPKKAVKPAVKPTPKQPSKKPQQQSSSSSKNRVNKAANGVASINLNKQASSNSNTSTSSVTQIPKVQLQDVIKLHKDSNSKPVLNLVIIGHVDAGKSTLTGHLLMKRGLVSNQEFHKLSKAADLVGKSSFKFAFILDDDETEREHGVTINVTKKSFSTDKYICCLADAPGHRDFVPNMISGAANADAAILVIDARTGEFETGFSENGQTREHALIVRSLGVTQLIIAVNKMDSVKWSADRFNQISATLGNFLMKFCGFSKKKITFVPVSGMSGDNLDTVFEGQEKSLMNCIDELSIPKRAVDKLCRIAITDISQATEGKLACVAKVESGTIQTNQLFQLQPHFESSEFIVQCSAVYRDNEESDESDKIGFYAIAGETAGMDLKPISGKFESVYSSGMWLSEYKKPMTCSNRFEAQFLILGGDAQTYDNVAVPPITKGFNITLHLGLCEVPGKIAKIISLLNKKTGDALEGSGKVRCLLKGQAAKVVIQTDRTVTADLENNISTRFTVRIQGITIGSGVIKKMLARN